MSEGTPIRLVAGPFFHISKWGQNGNFQGEIQKRDGGVDGHNNGLFVGELSDARTQHIPLPQLRTAE